MPGGEKISKKRGTPVEKNESNFVHFYLLKMAPKYCLIRA